jgi:hypothetical protein
MTDSLDIYLSVLEVPTRRQHTRLSEHQSFDSHTGGCISPSLLSRGRLSTRSL